MCTENLQYISKNIIIQQQYTVLMSSNITKTLSHRRLFKQKTKQPLHLQISTHKTSQNRNKKQDQTSIDVHDPDTSLSNRLSGQKTSNKFIISQKQINYHLSRNSINGRICHNRKFKSLDVPVNNTQHLNNIRQSFSIKKLVKNSVISQAKYGSMQNLQANEGQRKLQKMQYIPKSENYLKQTLKKSNINKLKIKVKDPFQKRTKLEIQFQDNSLIGKLEDSMISTLNRDQFRDLLSKIV